LHDGDRHGQLELLLEKRGRQIADLTRENTHLTLSLQSTSVDSSDLKYFALRRRIADVVGRTLPRDSTLLVISKGDSSLVDLPGFIGCHFPQNERGTYAGHHPADSAEAIAHLESLRAKGARYLLIPEPAFWWLDYYAAFREHLERCYRVSLRTDDSCVIYDLSRNMLPVQVATGSEGAKTRYWRRPAALSLPSVQAQSITQGSL
jgi:hypothetical protein